MSDGSLLIGIDCVPYECFVQVAGSGLRIHPQTLKSICDDRPAVRERFMKWLHVLGIQTSHTVLANGGYSVEERLARWLLMCQDRLGGVDIDLTHDFLGTMLAVQRSTVTLATHLLEGARLIRARRGRITILDREGLMAIADGSYGIAEAEYERIIGPFRS